MQDNKKKQKTKTGTVISNKMDKTVVVRVDTVQAHPKYGKVVTMSSKFYAHNEIDGLTEGDSVVIAETRPLSKLKRWRVVEKN